MQKKSYINVPKDKISPKNQSIQSEENLKYQVLPHLRDGTKGSEINLAKVSPKSKREAVSWSQSGVRDTPKSCNWKLKF